MDFFWCQNYTNPSKFPNNDFTFYKQSKKKKKYRAEYDVPWQI